MIDVCPVCGLDLVRVWGKPRSKILLVGEAPGTLELAERVPFVGNTGQVLKDELHKLGLDFNALRATNLWMHPIPKGKGTAEQKAKCFEFMMGQLMEQLATVQAVLFMGAELSPLFFGHPVSKISGAKMTSKLLPRGVKVAMACFNPAIVLKEGGVVGDLRFALEQFAHAVQPIYKEMLQAR